MIVHWGSFWLGVAALTIVEFIFFSVYIKLAERRMRKAIKETERDG